MILRDKAGYAIVDTADPEEFIAAYDQAQKDGDKVHWDDPETLDIDTIRDHAEAQRQARIERMRADG